MKIQPMQMMGVGAIADNAIPPDTRKKYKKVVQILTVVQIITIQRLAERSIADNRKAFLDVNGTKTGGIIEDVDDWLSSLRSPEYDSDPENEFKPVDCKSYNIEDLGEDPGDVHYVHMKPYAGENKGLPPNSTRAFIEYAKRRGFITQRDKG